VGFRWFWPGSGFDGKRVGCGYPRPEEHEPLALDFGGGAGAFAIDGQRGNARVLEVGTQPIIDEAIQFGRVQALEDAADGRFAGSHEFASLAATAGTQAAELVLVERLGELADVDQGVIARNHRGGSNGHDGGDATCRQPWLRRGRARGATPQAGFWFVSRSTISRGGGSRR